jgi:prenylcysteine alpha-carboxyl methylesterase
MISDDVSPASASSNIVPRSLTSIGFETVKRARSFYVPSGPVIRSRSLAISGGWEVAPYPRPHRGRFGAIVDFLLAIYHEIPVVAPLVSKLIRLLGLGVKAYTMLFRLIIFSFSLSPAIIKAGAWWWRSRTISRGIPYGKEPRNFLDIYHVPGRDGFGSVSDDDVESKRPVVVYVTGGAWIIGYKAWAAPLGEYLSKNGVMMVSVDYRNFPQGTLRDMQEDVESALDWVWDNIEKFGGDRTKILLVGQSAGAQILSSVLLKRASLQQLSNKAMPLSAILKFVGVSGPYDIVSLAPLMNKRGLYHKMLLAIMDNDLFSASPQRLLSSMTHTSLTKLPPILLLHGTGDNTVPYTSSVEFFESLRKYKLDDVQLELWPNVSHSEPLVEGPAAGLNFLGARLVLEATGVECVSKSEPLANERLIKLAKFVMPF